MIPLDALFADHQGGHSDLQMDSFITIRSGGTLYGCYKQALRELWKRYRGAKEFYSQRRLLAIELEKLACDAETLPDEFERRIAAENLRRKRESEPELAAAIVDAEREFVRFYCQAASLRDALVITDDNPLTPERRAVLDAEFWEHQIRCTIAVDLLTCGRPAANTLTMLQSLPIEIRKRIGSECILPASHQRLFDWFANWEPAIPAPACIPEETVRRLLCSE